MNRHGMWGIMVVRGWNHIHVHMGGDIRGIFLLPAKHFNGIVHPLINFVSVDLFLLSNFQIVGRPPPWKFLACARLDGICVYIA